MKKIKLTQGKFTVVDDDDYGIAMKHTWYASLCGGKWYAARGVTVGGNRRTTHLHRMILPGVHQTVDHINGDTLDNRRCNLRAASYSENQRNKGKPRTSAPVSKYKGVALNRNCTDSWYAFIRLDGKKKRLGTYRHEVAAALAYDRAVRERDGAYARLNFPYGIG